MKKIYYNLALYFCFFTLQAQQIQWANKLIKYSSDLGGKEYGIKRILGKPDVFPQAGYSPNAWTPKRALDGYETVVVGFEKSQTVKQIAIFENINAGCVVRVLVSTDGEKFEGVWGRKPDYKTPIYRTTLSTDRGFYFGRKRRKIEEVPSVFNPGIETIILDNAISGVVAIKVEFNFALIPGQKQIDAIGISDSATPIQALINTKPQLESILSKQVFENENIGISMPYITHDGEKMYVTQYVNEKEKIFSFTNQNGNWLNKTEETQFTLNDSYNYIEFINDQFMLVGGSEYSKGTGESGYMIYEKINDVFTPKNMLKITAFNNYDNFSDATATTNLDKIILTIESDFSQGETDLYFTQKKEDGTYGLLQNMGKVINSAASESTPFLLSDQKTLLFSSAGFSGFGNTDLYISYRLDETWKNWSEPINLGSKINTLNFDGQPFYDEINEKLYYSSSVDGTMKVFVVSIPKSVLTNLNN